MTEDIFYFIGPRIGLGAFANNFGWLQFRYFLAGILVIWATCSFAQESLLNGSDLAPLEVCDELRLNDAGTINEPLANRSGQACMGLAVVRCKAKFFAPEYSLKSECPNPEFEGWQVKLTRSHHVIMKEAKWAGALGESLPSGEVDNLRQMPWTRIGYRGATVILFICNLGRGHLGSTGEAECLLLPTAQQVIFLTSYTLRSARRN